MTREEIYKELEKTFIIEENYSKMLESLKEENDKFTELIECIEKREELLFYRNSLKQKMILVFIIALPLPIICNLIGSAGLLTILLEVLVVRYLMKNNTRMNVIDEEVNKINEIIYDTKINFENISWQKEKEKKIEEEINKLKDKQKQLVEQLGYIEIKGLELEQKEPDKKTGKIMMKKYPQR